MTIQWHSPNRNHGRILHSSTISRSMAGRRTRTHTSNRLLRFRDPSVQFRQTNRTRLTDERTTNRQTNRTAFRNPSVQFRTSARLTDKQTEQHLGVPLCSSVYPSFTEPAPERVAPHLTRGATLPCSASAHACSVLAGFQRWSISRPITRPSPPPPTAAAASVGALSVSYVSGPAYTSLLAVTALHASRACRAQPRVRSCQSSPVSTRT